MSKQHFFNVLFVIDDIIMPYTLESRYLGAQLADFERKVANENNVGWVKYLGRNKEYIFFRLNKTPYPSQFYSKNVIYYCQASLAIPNDSLVELETGRVPADTRYTPVNANENLYSKTEFFEVLNYKPRSVNEFIPGKPVIDAKDFMYRLTENWRHAELDHLEKAFVVQILSSPPRFFGNGGVGSQTLSTSGEGRTNARLKRSTYRYLPKEFSNPSFYHSIRFFSGKSKNPADQASAWLGNDTEHSYNLLNFPLGQEIWMPSDIPTILYNAQYVTKERYFDPEVNDYVLTSLMYNPALDERTIKLLLEREQSVNERIRPQYSGLPIQHSSHALSRLALSICRLEQKEKLTETEIRKAEDWLYTISNEAYDLSAFFAKIPTINDKPAITKIGLDILKGIFRLRTEYSLDYVSKSLILKDCTEKKISEFQCDYELSRLVQSAYIIIGNNGLEYKPLQISDNIIS